MVYVNKRTNHDRYCFVFLLIIFLFGISMASPVDQRDGPIVDIPPWHVGQSVKYKHTFYTNGKLVKTEYVYTALTGQEDIDDANYIWREVVKSPDQKDQIINKCLIALLKTENYEKYLLGDFKILNIQRNIVQQGGQIPREITKRSE